LQRPFKAFILRLLRQRIQIPNLQTKLNIIGRTGYRHHVSMTFGQVADAVKEAFTTYLGYTPTELE
jgi:hypothetical protein